MDTLKWFFRNFDSFPRRFQVMVGMLVMEIAMVILIISTASFVWFVSFFVLFIASEVAMRVHWGGKTMTQVLHEWLDTHDKE